jgi:DNA-binding SARP family transcriptional activator/TolB-like protein/Tfp pilus assembly protein PilF
MRKPDRQGPIRILLRVLGRFAVMVEGDPPSELRISSRKGQALLAYLAMHPDHSASREHLAALFWGDRRDEQARHNLRQCLVTLRRDLLKGAADILLVDPGTVGLRTSHLSIDADEFAALAESPEAFDLERSAALYRGEFLSEFALEEPFDSWVQRTRSQLDDVAARVFEACAEQSDARGEGKQAVAAAERLIAFDTFREDRQRIALRIFARYRGREFALTHADACVALLRSELGVDPEPATQALIDDIRRGTMSIVPTAPPERSEDTVDPGGGLEQPSVVPSIDGDPPILAERPRSGQLNAIPAAAPGRPTWRRAPVLAAAGLCVVALLFALPWMSSWFESSDPLSTQDRATSARTAMVETRGAVPIVLLPFTSSDAATANLAKSLTENVNDTLSRFAGLGVISQQTALGYGGRRVDAAAIGNELGVRYVVEGRIKSEGSRTSINVQLVDTANRLEIWSDRFERDDIDRSATQDEIAARIARGVQIAVTLAEAGQRQSAETRGQEPSVGSLLVRGLAIHFGGPSRNNVAEELALFEEALRREPELPQAMLGVGMALTQAALNSLADDPRGSLDRAEKQLDRVLEKEPASYRAYYWKALVAKARGRYNEAYDLISKSIEFNPSLPLSFAQLGDILTRLERPTEGLDHILHAIRVSPKDTSTALFYLFAGTAELELHHERAAADWFRRAIAVQPANPTPYKYLAAAYALMGNRTEAADSWNQFRRLSVPPALKELADKLQPETVSGAKSPESRLRDGLRIALTL